MASIRLVAAAASLTLVFGVRADEPGCPGSIQWDAGAGTTAWTTISNWSPNVVPGASDDVCIPDLAVGVEVVHATGTHAVHSLAGTGGVQVSGGTLSFAVGSPGLVQLVLSGGTLSGAGDLPVSGAFSWTGGTMSGAGRTTATNAAIGGGTKNLVDARVLRTNGSTVWTNTGLLKLDTASMIENLGTWDAQGNASIVNLGSAGPFENPLGSTFKKTGGGGATTIGVPFQNGGMVSVQSGTMSFEGGSTSTGSIEGGASTTVQFMGGAHMLAAGSSLTAGTVYVGAGSLSVDGTYSAVNSTFLDAAVAFRPSATVTQMGSLLISGSASVDLSSGDVLNVPRLAFFGGTLSGTDTLTATGLDSVWAGGTMSGPGTTEMAGGSLSSWAPMDLTDGRVLRFPGPNSHTVDWDGSAPIRLGSGATIENTLSFEFDAGSILDLGGAGGFRNQPFGWFDKSSAGACAVEVPFTNRGVVYVGGGTVQFMAGYTQLEGTTRLSDSDSTLSATTPLDIRGGKLDGDGTVAASVVSSGIVYAGGLTIDGSYTQTAQGTLWKDPPASSDPNPLVVTGAVALSGTLRVTLSNGYVPVNGDTFTILTAPEITGSFTTFDVPRLPGGVGFLIRVEPTQVVLEIAPDSDGDGVADAGDCAPADTGARSAPTESAHLVFASDKQTLSWDYQGTAGWDTVYDAVSGLVAELPVGGVGEICVVSGAGSPHLVDATTPEPGSCFYYLVRARNVCGVGTYGTATGGVPRLTAACP